MRRLTASVLLVMLSTVPGMARPYPWCASTISNNGDPDCKYITFKQCQAAANGIGECIQNPAVLFGPQPGTRNSPPPNAGWQDDGSNNGRREKKQW